VFGRASLLNCGLCLLRGTVRTSTSKVTPQVLSISTNSSTVLVECPIVKTVNCGSLAKQRPSSIDITSLKYKNSTNLLFSERLSIATNHFETCNFVQAVLRNLVKKSLKQSFLVLNSHKESKLVKSSRNLQTEQIA